MKKRYQYGYRGETRPDLPTAPPVAPQPIYAPLAIIPMAAFPDTRGKILPTVENLQFMLAAYGIAYGWNVATKEPHLDVPGLNLDRDIPQDLRLDAAVVEIHSKAARCGLPTAGLSKQIMAECVRYPFYRGGVFDPIEPNTRIRLT
ncbi:MAG TPA: hypothetical protein ENI94_06560 [Gammaproteobacteria bacterium]|nr:hypothetical protein [Gammaproteobacteria bacterium]